MDLNYILSVDIITSMSSCDITIIVLVNNIKQFFNTSLFTCLFSSLDANCMMCF